MSTPGYQGRHRSQDAIISGGFPAAGHPESLALELPAADEDRLTALAAELWPDDEFVRIIREDSPDEGGQL